MSYGLQSKIYKNEQFVNLQLAYNESPIHKMFILHSKVMKTVFRQHAVQTGLSQCFNPIYFALCCGRVFRFFYIKKLCSID